MNCASARCSRASEPFIRVKRAPLIFTAASKSSRPRAAPMSTWSFAAKSNLRGSPTRRTSTFSSADLPTGTLACGRFGIASRRSVSRAWMPSSSASIDFNSSPTVAICAISAVVSSPLRLSSPICFDDALRLDCRSCVLTCAFLRCSSSARNAPTSIVTPRVASPTATASRSPRIN